MSYEFLRTIMMKKAYESLEILKLLYLNYAKNSKFMSWASYLNNETMRDCFVDSLSIDISSSYQAIFISMRQLSIFLSQIVKNPSADRIKTIYNWQFLNCLILLGRSISLYKDLNDLVYPLIQITTGVLSLTNIPKYFPLKLHLIRILISIQSHCKVYIPSISPNIVEILVSPSLHKMTIKKKIKDFSFVVAIKASKEQLSLELYREQLVDECCECLIEHLASVGNTSAFPELVLPVKIALKKHCKNLRNSVFREKIMHCLRLVDDNSEWVLQKRKELNSIHQDLFVDGENTLKKKWEKISQRRKEIVNSKLIS